MCAIELPAETLPGSSGAAAARAIQRSSRYRRLLHRLSDVKRRLDSSVSTKNFGDRSHELPDFNWLL
jgi:hypothetical protein